MKEKQRWNVILALVVAIGVGLRILAARGDLWLDEIWSLALVAKLTSPFEILTKLRDDNNHILNSLWLWCLGGDRNPIVYRLVSTLAAVFSLCVIAWAPNLFKSKLERAIVLLLIALSYPMVLYGSEARGYSLMLACVLLAYCCALTLKDRLTFGAWLGFIGACLIGPLAHPSFSIASGALVLWVTYCQTLNRGVFSGLKCTLAVFLPVAAITELYTFEIFRHTLIAGANLTPFLQVWIDAFSAAYGGTTLSYFDIPTSAACAALAAVLGALFIIEIWLLICERDPRWVLFLLATLLLPMFAIYLLQPDFIIVRYLLVPILFSYFVIGGFAARMASRSRLGGVITCVLLVLFVFGSSKNTWKLLQNGRSLQRQALTEILQGSKATPILVAGEQDFRNALLLQYWQPIVFGDRPLTYLHFYPNESPKAEWIIIERPDRDEPHDSPIDSLEWIGRYPSPLLSGVTWDLYHRAS